MPLSFCAMQGRGLATAESNEARSALHSLWDHLLLLTMHINMFCVYLCSCDTMYLEATLSKQERGIRPLLGSDGWEEIRAALNKTFRAKHSRYSYNMVSNLHAGKEDCLPPASPYRWTHSPFA